jgi:amino acid transporter
VTADPDARQLADLGYTSEFHRDMSLWANFSLGFTYLSPVVGVYTLSAVSLAVAGPPMIWSLVIVGVGWLLVALVFGEIVSQYPIASTTWACCSPVSSW